MAKRTSKLNPSTTPFSIAQQFTGPPFSFTLQSAQLRLKLMEEMAKSKAEEPVAPKPAAKTKRGTTLSKGKPGKKK